MNHKKLIYGGITILTLSIIIGTLGTFWSIYSSFEGLKVIENIGIGAVSSGIESAIYFTIFLIVGTIFGLIMIVFGIVKQRRNLLEK